MNKPGKIQFNVQANTLRDERGFVADCNGMPPHYRELFIASPDIVSALFDFVSYSRCAQANASERKMLAERFAELGEKHEPLLRQLGFSPSQIARVDFEAD